jgi:hypothetical protein
MIKSVNTIQKLSLGQYDKTSPIRIFSVLARFKLDRNPLDVTTFARKSPERYWTGLLIKVSLRDVFHIGLVIGPRSAAQANTAGLGPIRKTSRNNTILLINHDLLALISSNLSIQYTNFHWANTTKTSPMRIFSVLARFRSVQ